MSKTNKETYELYVHTNKVNGKKYVGISQDSELRWGKDGKGYIKLNDKGCFRDAIDKHGWGNFEHKIIMKNLTLSKAKTMETLFITSLNTMAPFGYNLTLGGDGIFGYNHTKEGREIQSKRNSKPVLQFDNYKNFVSKYKSATDAEKALGISGVGRVCNGLRKTAGGYVWKWGEFVE